MAKKMTKTDRGYEVVDEQGNAWLWPFAAVCRGCNRSHATHEGRIVNHRGDRSILCRGGGAFVGRRIDVSRAA